MTGIGGSPLSMIRSIFIILIICKSNVSGTDWEYSPDVKIYSKAHKSSPHGVSGLPNRGLCGPFRLYRTAKMESVTFQHEFLIFMLI